MVLKILLCRQGTCIWGGGGVIWQHDVTWKSVMSLLPFYCYDGDKAILHYSLQPRHPNPLCVLLTGREIPLRLHIGEGIPSLLRNPNE